MTLSEYARTLSPTTQERDKITRLYSLISGCLCRYDCVQIGSYPRYTAITPVHDLDILCCLGDWIGPSNPAGALDTIANLIKNDVSLRHQLPSMRDPIAQEHSVQIHFVSNEYPSVDIVPCYKSPYLDDYYLPIYYVPEIMRIQKSKRQNYVWNPYSANGWILSDPRGYIKEAELVNAINGNFRKAVKIAKKWKGNLYAETGIKLKSFHLEQVILGRLGETMSLMMAVQDFFRILPEVVERPNTIPDKAQHNRYIDAYLSDFSYDDKNSIKLASRCVGRKLFNPSRYQSWDEIFGYDISSTYFV